MARQKKEEVQQEKDKKFKLKLTLKSGVDGVDAYIEEVRSHFLEFNVTDIRMSIEKMSSWSARVVENLFDITGTEDPDIPTMEAERTEEVFGKLITIVNHLKKVVELCELSQDIIKEIDEVIEEEEANIPQTASVSKAVGNIFEETMEKVKRGGK